MIVTTNLNIQNMKKIIVSLLVACLMFMQTETKAQQDVMVSQYMFNGLLLNPAYSGSHPYFSATLLHRSQCLEQFALLAALFEPLQVLQQRRAERGQPRIRGVGAVQLVEFVQVATELADAHQIGGPLGQRGAKHDRRKRDRTSYACASTQVVTLRIFAPRIRGINRVQRVSVHAASPQIAARSADLENSQN